MSKMRKVHGHTIELSNDNVLIIFSDGVYREEWSGGNTNFTVFTPSGDFFRRMYLPNKYMKEIIKLVENDCTLEDVIIWEVYDEL